MKNRYLIGLILSIVALAAVPSIGYAISGRYVDVDIEVFHGWGFLGLGTWERLEPHLISVRIEPLPGGDAAVLGVDYAFHRDYRITPSLGDPYRVVLTNRTDSLLGVVLAIDGLNTNGDAEVTGTDADKKWILLPNQTVRIAGWQVGTDRALAFSFATPSSSHSPDPSLRGLIRVYAYLPSGEGEPAAKGTGAGALVDQPTVVIPFHSASHAPVEVISIGYGRARVGLGFLCGESDGVGILVESVVPGTIADLRGLRAGDLISYANGVPIDSCSDLAELLTTRSPGDRIVVKVHRQDRAFLLMLEIEE